MFKIQCATLLTILFLASCSSMPGKKSINIDEELPLRLDSFTEIDNTEGKMTRVITRIRQPIGSDINAKILLLKKLEQMLDRELGKESITMVNRNLGKTVQNEKELAELYGKEAGREDVDVALLLVLDEAHSGQNTETKERWTSDKKYLQCNYSVSFKGWLRAYEIPSMKTISQWDFQEKNDKNFEVSSSSECTAKSKNKLQILQDHLLDHAMCRNKQKIFNVLGPTGHILTTHKNEDKTTLEISLGSDLGINKGDIVRLYHELSNNHYAKGKVVGEITRDSSHIKLMTLEKGATVHESDYVRPYTKTFFEKLRVNCLI